MRTSQLPPITLNYNFSNVLIVICYSSDPLYFYEKLPNQFLVQNIDSKVYCKARGASPPIFRWYRDKDGQDEV